MWIELPRRRFGQRRRRRDGDGRYQVDRRNDRDRRPTGTGGATGSGGAAGEVGGLFTQPEPWTKDVSGLTKDASSDAIIAALDKAGGWGGGRLQIDFSIPLFFANASTPRETIEGPMPGGYPYCYGGTDCDAVPFQMPIPANGNAEGSTNYTCDTSGNTDGQGDCHILVVETGQQKLYELYNATQNGSAIDALVAVIWDLTKTYPDNERGDQCTSADAGGFPIAGAAADGRRGGRRRGQPRASASFSRTRTCGRRPTFTRPRTPAARAAPIRTRPLTACASV